MLKTITSIVAIAAAIVCYGERAIALATLSAETSRPVTSTFPMGEAVKVAFSASGLTPGANALLSIDVRNEYGEAVATPAPIKVSGDGDGNALYQFSAPAGKLGYYEIRAALSDGTQLSALGTRPAGIITYAVVPDPLSRVDYGDRLSHFGVQGGYSVTAAVIPYLGIRYMHGGSHWANLEADHAGQFAQDRFVADRAGKRYPERNSADGHPLFGRGVWNTYQIATVTKASLPSWALRADTSGKICKTFGELTDAGETGLPVFALAQAKAFAADYKDQSQHFYQVTWEPADWCYGGTPAGLVKIFERAYAAIHQADAKAVVAGPTLFIDADSTKQLSDLWTAGLGRYVDALSIHPYVKHWPPEENGFPDGLREQLNAANKAVGHPIPFFGTEHGFKSVELGGLKKAMGDIRTTLMMLGEGAAFDIGFYIADFWDGDDPTKTDGYGFYWNLNTRIDFGTDKLGPKVVVPAYAAMTYFLDGAVSKGPLPNLSGTQLGYRFVRDDKTIYVVWDYRSQSSYRTPPGASICDWMGNCSKGDGAIVMVSGAPTYFIAGVRQGGRTTTY